MSITANINIYKSIKQPKPPPPKEYKSSFYTFVSFHFLLQDNLKLDRFYIPLFYDDFMHLMDILSETLNTTMGDFPPVLGLMNDVYIDKYLETTEEKLNVVMERLTHLEKHKDEL